MATVNLQNEETMVIDLGSSSDLSAKDVSPKDAKFYVDHYDGSTWKPVFGEIALKPGETQGWTRAEIGHDHVRVGARGVDDGTTIVTVTYEQ